MPFLVIPGLGKLFFYSFFNGVSQCAHCGETENYAFWKGEVSDSEMELWRIRQEKEDRIKADRDRRFRKVAIVVFGALTILIIIFRSSMFR